jgi:hypothetical protein
VKEIAMATTTKKGAAATTREQRERIVAETQRSLAIEALTETPEGAADARGSSGPPARRR